MRRDKAIRWKTQPGDYSRHLLIAQQLAELLEHDTHTHRVVFSRLLQARTARQAYVHAKCMPSEQGLRIKVRGLNAVQVMTVFTHDSRSTLHFLCERAKVRLHVPAIR